MIGFKRALCSDADVSGLLTEPVRAAQGVIPLRVTIQADYDSERIAKRAQQAELRRLVSSLRQMFPSHRAGRAGASVETPARTAQTTVLLVDDDPTLRRVVGELLAHLGYAVLTAYDGQQAIDVLQEHAGHVALVLMDVRMPRMDARAALPILEAKWPALPVLLSSSDACQANLRGWQRPNVVGFLPKPYALSALEQAIAQATLARVPSSGARS